MNTKAKYNEACPSVFTYEKYLQNSLETSEKANFENHISSCALCQEAIEGYKSANIVDISKNINKKPHFHSHQSKSISPNTFIRYAATVLILISFGIGTKYIIEGRNSVNYLNQYVSINDYSQFKTIATSGAKKLSRKTTDQYLYLGNENQALINDQIINIDELISNESLNNNTEKIIIQVENNNHQNSQQIVDKIKQLHNIPVFTIRTIH